VGGAGRPRVRRREQVVDYPRRQRRHLAEPRDERRAVLQDVVEEEDEEYRAENHTRDETEDLREATDESTPEPLRCGGCGFRDIDVLTRVLADELLDSGSVECSPVDVAGEFDGVLHDDDARERHRDND
jgi:hypothetical protein